MLRFVLFSIATLLLIGCSSGSSNDFQGKLEPVTGTVLVNEQPLAGVQVFFVPTGDTPGAGAQGMTDEAGKFLLTHRSDQPGVEAGEYKVLFSRMAKADGTPLGPEDDMAISGVEFLPAYYQNPDKTPEKATVPSGGGDFQYQLKGKK